MCVCVFSVEQLDAMTLNAIHQSTELLYCFNFVLISFPPLFLSPLCLLSHWPNHSTLCVHDLHIIMCKSYYGCRLHSEETPKVYLTFLSCGSSHECEATMRCSALRASFHILFIRLILSWASHFQRFLDKVKNWPLL